MNHTKACIFLSLLLVIGLAVSACAPASQAPQEPFVEATEATNKVVVDAPELVMFTNVGAKEVVDEVIAPAISERFGVTLLVEEKISSEQITSLIAQKGNPEVSLTCGLANFDVPIALENDLFAPLDYSKLPNADDLFDIATTAPYGEMGIAWNGAVSWIQYYKPVFEENGWDPPTSYAEFADPKYAGHVALTSATSGVGIMFLEYYSRDAGADTGDISPALEFAAELVESGQVHSFPTRSSEVNELMVTGEVWIANQISSATNSIIADGAQVGASIPKEGTGLFTEGCHLVANAPNADIAHEVINMIIGPEFQQAFVEHRPAIMFRTVDVPDMFTGVIPATEEEIGRISSIDLDTWARFRQIWRDDWIRKVEAAREQS